MVSLVLAAVYKWNEINAYFLIKFLLMSTYYMLYMYYKVSKSQSLVYSNYLRDIPYFWIWTYDPTSLYIHIGVISRLDFFWSSVFHIKPQIKNPDFNPSGLSRWHFHTIAKTKNRASRLFVRTHKQPHGAAVAMAATYFCPSVVSAPSLQSGHTELLRPSRPRSPAHLLLTLLSTSGVLQFISPMARY